MRLPLVMANPFVKFPYVPQTAPAIGEVQKCSDVPYISALDLLVFKIYCCSMRPVLEKRFTDAEDILSLWESCQSQGPIEWSAQQSKAIEDALSSFSEFAEKDEEWWRRNLGLHRE